MCASNASCDWANDHVEEDQTIGQHNGPVPKLVGKQFWQRKRSKLAVPGAETDHDMRGDGLADAVRRSSNDAANEDQDVAEQDEVSPSEEIAVGTANHESNCPTSGVDGRDPNHPC